MHGSIRPRDSVEVASRQTIKDILIPSAGSRGGTISGSHPPMADPFCDPLRRYVAGVGGQADTVETRRLEAPLGDEAKYSRGDSPAAHACGHPVARERAPVVAADVRKGSAGDQDGRGVRDRKVRTGSRSADLGDHKEKFARAIRPEVWRSEHAHGGEISDRHGSTVRWVKATKETSTGVPPAKRAAGS